MPVTSSPSSQPNTPAARDDGRHPDPAIAWHREPAVAVASRLGVDPTTGLTSTEVRDRLARVGANRLAEPPRRPGWRRFADQFRSPLVLILAGAAVLAALLGDIKDPIVIGVVLLINALLGYLQEGKAERALAALQQMVQLHVKVRRDGQVVEVAADELVPGDLVLLEAGDRVPADGRIVAASSAAADESALTGESVPADKTADALAPGDHDGIGDRSNMAFMNSTIVRGRVELLVTATGMGTEIGRIAGMLAAEEQKKTPLERQLHTVGVRLAMVAGVAVSLVFVLSLLRGESFADAMLESVALAVAAIPEGLPAVVTVTLAVGVSQMAKRNAIVKRLASVETLGSTTVICSDKTGTLTLNEMTAAAVVHGDDEYVVTGMGYDHTTGHVEGRGQLPVSLDRALQAAALCNDATVRDGGLIGDPTEGALVVLAQKGGVDVDALRRALPRVGEVPFDSATKIMATVHDDGDRHVVVKGAPEVVLARCSHLATPYGPQPFDAGAKARIDQRLASFAARGLRVLAVASRSVPADEEFAGDAAPSPAAVSAHMHDLHLQALVGIIDPPRAEARDAIRLCKRAGIAVKMITGDHAATAEVIARDLGIEGRVVSGAELDRMSDEQLADEIDGIGVCARVSPEHKVRVVRALRARDHVVAMTGDGVNDAAALKAADIGVAMGITGTEVTKEAGDLILADDNFATIVAAVERGRTIFENIVTFVRFQLSTNLGAILTIVTAGLVGLPAPFTALQVLFVNLIADGPPAMSLGVDPPKPGTMDHHPRGLGQPVITMKRVRRLLVASVTMAAGTIGVLAVAREQVTEPVALTMTFTTFVLFQLWNALNARTERDSALGRHLFTNPRLWGALGLVALLQVAVVHVGWMQRIFDTTSLSAGQWLVCVAVSLSVVAVEELRKLALRIAVRNAKTAAAAA